MKEMIITLRKSWFFSKFSLLAPQEMYREQYGEYTLYTLMLGVKD